LAFVLKLTAGFSDFDWNYHFHLIVLIPIARHRVLDEQVPGKDVAYHQASNREIQRHRWKTSQKWNHKGDNWLSALVHRLLPRRLISNNKYYDLITNITM